jgi:protein gp37
MAKQAEHGISWTEETWNPIRGCSRVSEGCRHCYAERIAYRFSGAGESYDGLVRIANGHPQWTGEVRVVEEHMLDPLHWKRPRRIFVNSMSDLFHENVSDETIDRIFAVMALCPQHTFQVLTKRPARMLAWFAKPSGFRFTWREGYIQNAAYAIQPRAHFALKGWPLPNVWLGVSVENQAAADERIPLLLQTPAAVRWISAEPLLDGIDLTVIPREASDFDRSMAGFDRCKSFYVDTLSGCNGVLMVDGASHEEPINAQPKLDWVVVGGESGHGARPMEEAWARSLRDQCVAAGVAFHFKQWGEWLPAMCDGAPGDYQELNAGDTPIRIGKRKAGRLLDGRTWDEYPAGNTAQVEVRA